MRLGYIENLWLYTRSNPRPRICRLLAHSEALAEPRPTGSLITCSQMHYGLSSNLGTIGCLGHTTHRDSLRSGARRPVPGVIL